VRLSRIGVVEKICFGVCMNEFTKNTTSLIRKTNKRGKYTTTNQYVGVFFQQRHTFNKFRGFTSARLRIVDTRLFVLRNFPFIQTHVSFVTISAKNAKKLSKD